MLSERDTHDEWCSMNAEEPYVTWMEEHEQRGGYDAEAAAPKGWDKV
jgi:hypothetical protein